jgi:hypothetical protein
MIKTLQPENLAWQPEALQTAATSRDALSVQPSLGYWNKQARYSLQLTAIIPIAIIDGLV